MGFKLTPDSNSTKTSLDSPTTMPLALNLETLQCRFLSTIGPFPSNYIQISMQFMRQEINLKKLMQVSHVTSVSLGICLLVGFQLIRPLFVHIWILFLLVQIQIFFIYILISEVYHFGSFLCMLGLTEIYQTAQNTYS